MRYSVQPRDLLWLDYNYLREYYNMIVTDLSKQQQLMLIQKKHSKLSLLEI